jgi:hypothetical protein
MNEKKLDPSRCCESVSDGQRWPHFYQCKRKAAVTRDGKGYCNQHDPVAAKEREKKNYAKWKAQDEADDKRYRLNAAAPDLLAALRHIVAADIGGLTVSHITEARAAIAKAEGSK